jgi:hypothetical protein
MHHVESINQHDTRAQFHQRSKYNFYARGAQKPKKDSQVVSLFTLSESMSVKAERKYFGEIEPQCTVQNGRQVQRNKAGSAHPIISLGSE